ncbi:hypothetical protein Nepgr_012487 [Nepenthes gracilis]|uniref:Uncharacterized protein n=1 Tax=Nepenthes gracilis TaxID=150966 RepID=A0AAD3SHL3_NEPGR|nr:hypothetical protein Nepgr_012487 [Nepenthes gracilis]
MCDFAVALPIPEVLPLLETSLSPPFLSAMDPLLLADGAEDCLISSSVSSLGVPACSISDSGCSRFVSPQAKGAHCASQSGSDVLGSDSNLTVHDAPRCSVLPLVCPNTGEQAAPVQHEIVPQIGVANLMSTNSPICPGDPAVPIGSSPAKSLSKVKIKVGNLKEQSDSQFTEICFHYQWKPNQHKLPTQKGPEVIRQHPSGVYRPKSKNRVVPKPTSSGPSIGSEGPIQGKTQLSNSLPLSISFEALQDVEDDGLFVEKEIRRDGSCVGVALGSEKEDQFRLTKTRTGLHTTMVMEPLGDRFTRNNCPASVGDVSDEVNGNLDLLWSKCSVDYTLHLG